MSWIITGTQKLDPDAAIYIDRVEAADGQSLEEGVRLAYSTFVSGCKADGIWNAIKASCILAGARTLDGALQPLVGTAPTNFNFVAGDYNRKTGLVGDGSTKYLDSNRNNNADPQNDFHQACWVSALPTSSGIAFMGQGGGTTGNDQSNFFATGARNRTSQTVSFTASLGLVGSSRPNAMHSFNAINNKIVLSLSATSSVPGSASHYVFARNDGSPNQISNARLAFYSIGEALDLALLDNRVSTLISDLAAAIP